MKKIRLSEYMRDDFIAYSFERINKSNYNIKTYNHITRDILNNTFTFFLEHKLTTEENAKSYWYKNGEKNIECYGYTGKDINCRDDKEGMINNLYHEVFCYAEWIARSITQTWYIDTVKETIGNKNYYAITI